MTGKLVYFCLFVLFVHVSFSQDTAETNSLISIRDNMGHSNWVSTSRNGELTYDTTWNTGNPICGTGAENVNAWFGVICVNSHIEVLLLAANNLVGAIPTGISGLTYLEQFYIFDNAITGALPNTLDQLTRLTHLYAWDNQITSVLEVSGVTTLEKFYFERNSVADSNINWITTLPNLLELDASDNSITGTIPNGIQSAAVLRKINFNNNALSGTIPYNLLTHPEMIFVYLNNNQLTGAIPDGIDIGGMGLKLQNLDFGNNNLRCLIPDWIQAVSFPVDLRDNEFFCPVPTSTFNMLTTPENCIQVLQTGGSPTVIEINSAAGTDFTITGTNFDYCSSGDFECKFKDQFGTGFIVVDATSVTSTTITCPFPLFATGGGKLACVSQNDGVEITDDCTFIETSFDCNPACANGGFCNSYNGECICTVGYTGPSCEERDCGDCNEALGGGYCNTTSGLCICNTGWLGADCKAGTKTCNETCLNGGECNPATGLCVCVLGWQGSNCSERFCPPCHEVGGNCVNGTCVCETYWSGVYCNIPNFPCPGDGTCGSALGRGSCFTDTGVCNCNYPWTGEECGYRLCPNDCSGNGVCDNSTGVCDCDPSYVLPSCLTRDLDCNPADCNGRGRCIRTTGLCDCDTGFDSQPDCSVGTCKECLHGYCDNATATCICDDPWIGAKCNVANGTCPNDCNGNGFCDTSTRLCICPSGLYADDDLDCSTRLCPEDDSGSRFNCSGNGVCNEYGVCDCEDGWDGVICDRTFIRCPDDCNGNGFCDTSTGICRCYLKFEGESCVAKSCNNNCTSATNGRCNATIGACLCNEGYEGADCSLQTCDADCKIGGTCDLSTGQCSCDSGYRGENCALLSCPNACSGRGSCAGGVCFCDDGFSKDDCSQQDPDYALIILVIICAVVGGLVIIGVIFMIWRQVMIANLTAQIANGDGADLDDDISDS